MENYASVSSSRRDYVYDIECHLRLRKIFRCCFQILIDLFNFTPCIVMQLFFDIEYCLCFWFVWDFLTENFIWWLTWFEWCIAFNRWIPKNTPSSSRKKYCFPNVFIFLIECVWFTQCVRNSWLFYSFVELYHSWCFSPPNAYHTLGIDHKYCI